MNLLARAKEEKSSRRHSSPSSCSKQSASNVIGQRIKRLGDNRRCMGNSRILFGGMVFYAMIVGTVATDATDASSVGMLNAIPTDCIADFKEISSYLNPLLNSKELCVETEYMLTVPHDDVLQYLGDSRGDIVDYSEDHEWWKTSNSFIKRFNRFKVRELSRYRQEDIRKMMKLIYACRPLIRGFMIELNIQEQKNAASEANKQKKFIPGFGEAPKMKAYFTVEEAELYKLENWQKMTVEGFKTWISREVSSYKSNGVCLKKNDKRNGGVFDLDRDIINFFRGDAVDCSEVAQDQQDDQQIKKKSQRSLKKRVKFDPRRTVFKYPMNVFKFIEDDKEWTMTDNSLLTGKQEFDNYYRQRDTDLEFGSLRTPEASMTRQQSPDIIRAPRSPPAKPLYAEHGMARRNDAKDTMNVNPLNPLYKTMNRHQNFEAYRGTRKDYEKLCKRRGDKAKKSLPIVD